MKKNAVAHYHNDINQINLSNFTEKELNLFFSLLFLSKDQGTRNINLAFSELKELSNGDTHSERFIESLRNVNRKLVQLNHEIRIENKIYIFSLFNIFAIDLDEKTLAVQINEIFSYMLNDLIGNFTKFNLIEFVSLKSKYSKNVFKILKQWESLKSKTFDLEDFRKTLGVPEAYDFSKINEKILSPIMRELTPFFSNLKLEKIKSRRKVTHLKFTWQEEKKQIKTPEIIEIAISEDLFKSIEKTKKNRYIEGILQNSTNIEKLLKEFTEPQLIEGLEKAYKVVDKPVKSLLYLKKIIRSANEDVEKVVVVADTKTSKKKSEVELKDLKQNNVEQSCFKTRVTKAEYERIYEEYLKQNNVKHQKIIRDSFDIMKKNQFEIID